MNLDAQLNNPKKGGDGGGNVMKIHLILDAIVKTSRSLALWHLTRYLNNLPTGLLFLILIETF